MSGFRRPADWTRDEALAKLARRYFTGHGPATVQDLMHWAGLTAADAKLGLGAAGQALIQETIADRVYWMPREVPEINHGAPSVHLLPGFDEYVLGYGIATRCSIRPTPNASAPAATACSAQPS